MQLRGFRWALTPESPRDSGVAVTGTDDLVSLQPCIIINEASAFFSVTPCCTGRSTASTSLVYFFLLAFSYKGETLGIVAWGRIIEPIGS